MSEQVNEQIVQYRDHLDLFQIYKLQTNSKSLKMNKLTQDQIDRLANESEQDSVHAKKPKKKEEQENYEQQYDQQINEDYQVNNQQQQIVQQDNLHQLQQVRSQIEEENVGEMGDDRLGIQSKFKNDEDLSLAKSEFIESIKINSLADKKVAAQKPGLVENQKSKQPKSQKIQKKPQKNEEKQQIKKKVTRQLAANNEPPIKENKKQKLSQSEINRRMKQIKQSKEQLLRKKQLKEKKIEVERRKQYEQAKRLQEERKQKNKKILQEQKGKKKAQNAGQAKNSKKAAEQQIKLPEKRAEFKYMDMVKERKNQEKKIQKQIQAQNKQKLKRILQKPQGDLKGQAKKAAFMQQRKILKQREQKMRQLQYKQDQILIVKQTKQEINQARRLIKQKNQQINRAQKGIADLKKLLKEKQSKFYEAFAAKFGQQPEQFQQNNFSQMTPIEKFVHCFPQAKNPEQIFALIDANGDGVLSSEQIKEKLQEFKIEEAIINKIEEILDENSDGTVSKEQFVFLIQIQLKKLKDYKEIMGAVQIDDPLEMEAKIIDMQAKIKFITAKIEESNAKSSNQAYLQKIHKMQEKVKKLENKWKKQTEVYQQGNKKIDTSANNLANLTHQTIKLTNQLKMKRTFIEKLRIKVKQNLNQKNKLLTSKVQENIRISQQIFKIQNEIQQSELRYLSTKKIQQNKKGYLERQSKKQKQLQEAYKRTRQYQISIADPGKQAQIVAEKDEMRLLAAVLMIQRNYRRRKARGQFQKLRKQNAK